MLSDGERFATGAITYQYRPATTHETTPRIILVVETDGILTEAVVDTRGVYLFCNPHIVRRLPLAPTDQRQPSYPNRKKMRVGVTCRVSWGSMGVWNAHALQSTQTQNVFTLAWRHTLHHDEDAAIFGNDIPVGSVYRPALDPDAGHRQTPQTLAALR